MLMNLKVRDFAIIDQIDIEFDSGMTVLTGETGAGKSILVDALGLVLGERGSSKAVRPGAKRAEFSASFDTANLPRGRAWLEDNELDQDDDCLNSPPGATVDDIMRVGQEDNEPRCLVEGVRRVVNREVRLHFQRVVAQR